MADKRKLLGDIDRCHKKVAEGVESFKETWKKLQQACNANQKEKYEQDLKKEIKKLQRLRDQIKTWCASNDVKDKRALMEDRKLIETQMETFKIVERDSKTKAYSKEALGLPAKIDPAEKEKYELREWLNKTIESLNIECDKLEADVEIIHAQNRKGKSKDKQQDKLDELQEFVTKHKWHIVHLEALLRMLDNDNIKVNDVKDIQEEVDFYLTDYKEPDYVDNEYLYTDIVDPEILNSSLVDNRITTNQSDDNEEEEDNDSVMDDSYSQVSHESHNNNEVPSEVPPTSPTTKSNIKAKPAQPTPAPATRSRHPTPNSNTASVSTPPANTTTQPTHMKPPQPKTPTNNLIAPPTFSSAPPSSTTSSLYTNHHVPSTESIRSPPSVPASVPSSAPSENVQTPDEDGNQEAFVLDPNLGVSPLGPLPLTAERAMQLEMLEAAAANLPQPNDSNRVRSLNLINSFPNFPAQIPPHHYHSYDPKHNFDSFEYFKNLVPDTLFFIFYFYEGTRAQYYAAKALKEQHWRFHKKIKMWFQRYEEPKEIVESHETGTYVYFDIDLWQQRTKEDFKFEYKWLEENNLDE